MRALVVGGVGVTGTVIVEELLKRHYEVTVLHRGVHEAKLPPQVKHIHADPHWREEIRTIRSHADARRSRISATPSTMFTKTRSSTPTTNTATTYGEPSPPSRVSR